MFFSEEEMKHIFGDEKTEWLFNGAIYWYPDLCHEEKVDHIDWTDDEFDHMMLKRGLVCQTKKEAKEKAGKMLWAINSYGIPRKKPVRVTKEK